MRDAPRNGPIFAEIDGRTPHAYGSGVTEMEVLGARARKILYAAITEYIATGEPVGSRTLERRYGLHLSAASIRNVLEIAQVARDLQVTRFGLQIALATAIQESTLRNLKGGHADSAGLFQQRPSKGWGTVKQIMDPYYSSAKFYDALVRVWGQYRDWLGERLRFREAAIMSMTP